MKVMVFDVPAESGGALSVLNEVYNEVVLLKDKSGINWTFVVSKPKLKEMKNIKILRYPWIKKSWLHRLIFDNIVAPWIAKKHKIDKIISLQNVVIPNTNIDQILYVHNSLPFTDYKYSFIENKYLWFYQNIIGRSIVNSIKKAQRVIVQTKWMEQACLDKTGIDRNVLKIVPPKVRVDIKETFKETERSMSTFFYPASSVEFKNHRIIVQACKLLKGKNYKKHKVIFTVNGNENENIRNLYNEVKEHKLPIEFIGSLERERVFDFYSKSILLFPSYIETFGLPMLEAKLHKTFILASDYPFSHEILDGYDNVRFFDAFNEQQLAEEMEMISNRETAYIKNCKREQSFSEFRTNILDAIIEE